MDHTNAHSSHIADCIRSLLKEGHPFSLEVYEEIGSTNDRAKELEASGAPGWTAVLARRQSAGRGRMGRRFYSPLGGVYLSLLLRPDCDAADASLFTAATAVAVCRAIHALCGLNCRIKWPNDLLFRGRKVCGILTEAALGQGGRMDAMAIGIGLNLHLPSGGFPPELKDAGALFSTEQPCPSFTETAAALLNALHEQLFDMPHRRFLPEYRQRSMLIGKSIAVLQRGETRPATVRGIDENAGLCVEYPDGAKETLLSGEISIREDNC
ncbi:MAG: biotin--[acetyl-CoA-carboxylase] ligase [Christensenellales bacterium]|jgi:BirA family biotin operon repressor/biotin-[acetyl-CoA-carboxylase] ligase